MRKPFRLLVVLLAGATLAPGCGGGDDNGGGGGDGGSSASDPRVQESIQSCKQSVDSAQSLSASVKSELRDLCEKAGSGNEAEARKASQDVCVKIVKETIPAGATRDQAVDACEQNAQ